MFVCVINVLGTVQHSMEILSRAIIHVLIMRVKKCLVCPSGSAGI